MLTEYSDYFQIITNKNVEAIKERVKKAWWFTKFIFNRLVFSYHPFGEKSLLKNYLQILPKNGFMIVDDHLTTAPEKEGFKRIYSSGWDMVYMKV